MSEALFDIPLRSVDGSSSSLADFRGHVLLIVNVASKCGLTPQYAGLEGIYRRFKDSGLLVLAFPANNFANQEPGSNPEIESFCRLSYGVTFPVFERISIRGVDQHALYRELTRLAPTARDNPGGTLRATLEQRGMGRSATSDVLWNFEKFLIGRDGCVLGRFEPDVGPEDPNLVAAIESALSILRRM